MGPAKSEKMAGELPPLLRGSNHGAELAVMLEARLSVWLKLLTQ